MKKPETVAWRKSSHSGNQGGDCVETALLADRVGARDSKLNDSPVLTVRSEAWVAFLDATRR